MIRPQLRSALDPAKVRAMGHSLNASGLIYPVRLRLEEDGTLVPEDGHYRIAAAATELGWTDIPALVVRAPAAEAESTLRQLATFQRHDLNPMDRALAYERVLRQPGMTAERLAATVGQSLSQVCRLRALTGCKTAVQELVREGRLGASLAVLLSLISPQERYEALLQRAKEGTLTRADLELDRRSAARRPRKPASAASTQPRRVIALDQGCKLTLGKHVGSTRDLLDLLTALAERLRHACESGINDLAALTATSADGTPRPADSENAPNAAM